jgi:hypothetical protein
VLDREPRPEIRSRFHRRVDQDLVHRAAARPVAERRTVYQHVTVTQREIAVVGGD